jgi:hypothetical protein
MAELARLPFTSTLQNYANRFNAMLCHARNLSAIPVKFLHDSSKIPRFKGGHTDVRTLLLDQSTNVKNFISTTP